MPAIAKIELASRVTEICEHAAAGTGIEIVEVAVLGGGTARVVRIYIDKPGGVGHADCEFISERAGKLLDDEDVMPEESYTLEVSSPGIERKLTKARVMLVGRNLGYLYNNLPDHINPEGLRNNATSAFSEYGGAPFVRNMAVTVQLGF